MIVEISLIVRQTQLATRGNNLKADEYTYLLENSYLVNESGSFYSTNQCIEKYKSLLQNSNINLKSCLSAFICGFNSFPRGRQPILSYLFARAVPLPMLTILIVIAPLCSIKGNNWIQKR